MREWQDIVRAWGEAQRRGQAAVLATVVRVRGSSYRRPGARMLVTVDGVMAGSVSGGCLEADVVRRARRVLADGRPVLATYDTTDDRDIVFGVGLGCRGVIDILLEPVPADALAFLNAQTRARRPGVLATVFHVEGAPETALGQRLMVSGDGERGGDVASSALRERLRRDAEEVLQTETSRVQAYTVPNGSVEAFLEFVAPPTALLVCGAGPDAGPLTRLAKELGWHVWVWDERPDYAAPERHPQADVVLTGPPECLPEQAALDGRTAGVLATHNYLRDLRLLEALIPSPVAYLGALGPRRRTEQMLDDLRRAGATLPDDLSARLHGPAGLDIGAGAPEQIALAIVAEIQAVLAGRAGGRLRDRPGPIYAAVVADEGRDGRSENTFSCPLSE